MQYPIKSNIFKDVALVSALMQREFTIRYRGSFLGVLWVFGAPLLMITTYSFFMYGIVRPSGEKGLDMSGLVGLWLCLGLWQWLTESTNRSATTFHDNAAMVKKTPIKLYLLPIVSVVVSSLGYALPLAISICVMIWTLLPFSSFLMLGIGIISIMPWFFALALIASVLGTFLREVRYALPLCFNVGLFLSPILYSSEQAPTIIRPLLAANPLGHNFEFIKLAVSQTHFVFPFEFIASTVLGVFSLVLCALLFANRNGEFADVV